MKKTISMILVLVLGLVVWPTPRVYGDQYLTVDLGDVDSVTLELGELCTIEVVSEDAFSHAAYVGFADGLILGDFSHLETTSEAGHLADIAEFSDPASFSGYYVIAAGFGLSDGVHFVFQYQAQQIGETDVRLYDETLTVTDSVHITVVPAPMGTSFSYQKHLIEAADGLYDFQFKLFNGLDASTQEGRRIDINDVAVIDGHFTVELDFGSDVFNGDARWLEISFRPSESTGLFNTLVPRTELTPTPYAMYAKTASTARSLDAADGDPPDVVYVDDSGNVGIGTTSPIGKLHVSGHTYIDGSSLSSRVGIGTNEPRGRFHVNGSVFPTHYVDLRLSSYARIQDALGGLILERRNTAGEWISYGRIDGIAHDSTDGTEDGEIRMYTMQDGTFTSTMSLKSGNVGIGDSSPLYRLELPNNADTTGRGRANSWVTYSSRRWKTSIRPIVNALEKVKRLRGVHFDWKKNGKPDVGMIAEEVGEVLPEIVQYEEDGKYTSGMDYSKLTPILVEAIKELKEEGDQRQNELAEKDAEISELKSRLASLEACVAKLTISKQEKL